MVDRISDLPDEILCHILTFLPTKFAFATSVLSKRWISLYQSLTIVNFNDESVKDHGDFLHLCRSVDAIILSPHVQHKPLQKLYLMFSRFGDWHPLEGANVHKWIEAAKQRGVKDIRLSMKVEIYSLLVRYESITLTDILFNFPNLVVLKLKGLNMPPVAKILSVINLPSLKTLHLNLVRWDNINDFKKFLSGCPNLEEMHINLSFIIDNVPPARGFELEVLSKLVRTTISSFEIPFKAISNVEFLRILKMDKIDHIKVIDPWYKEFPVFCNLIHLEIEFQHSDHGWNNVAKVLQHSPKLQILSIKKGSSNYFTYRKDWENPNFVPECVSSHLTTCKIINYEGKNGDLQFARYIFQNARFLRVMRIKICSSQSYRKSQILKEFPRNSNRCKFLFES